MVYIVIKLIQGSCSGQFGQPDYQDPPFFYERESGQGLFFEVVSDKGCMIKIGLMGTIFSRGLTVSFYKLLQRVSFYIQ